LEAGQCYFELSKNPQTAFLGLKGAIRSALHNSDINGANLLLERAEKILPSSTWVLKHQLGLARKLKKYKTVERLILRLEDLGRLSSEQSKLQVAHVQYQLAMDAETSELDKEALLKSAHLLDPSHTEITMRLAELLSDRGQTTFALTSIEATWALSPSQKLGDLYLKISAPKNELEAYEVASKFVKKAKKTPMSQLLLARTAMRAKLWGESRAHLTKLLLQEQSTIVYELLMRLELEEHQDIRAALKWLELTQDKNVSRETVEVT